MLETILKALGAGDQVLTTMGPLIAWILAWLGGYGITQTFKFPLKRVLPAVWTDWLVRMFAISVTFLCTHFLGSLPWMLEVVIAFSQPVAYKVFMAIVKKQWPWLEASAFGSADPSRDAQVAAAVRKLEKGNDGTPP
jgi:hypothetical protein